MRVALISDIHGNHIALTTVLDDIARVGVDQICCLGDVATLGPAPREVIQILRELGPPCVQGNHDAFLTEPGLIQSYTAEPVITGAVAQCHDELTSADVAYLRTFQPTIELELDGGCRMLLFHGTPRSHMENLLATTPAEELERMLEGHVASIMAGGHTHIQMLRQHCGALIVNPGSVGMPFKEFVAGREPRVLPHAEYAIVEARGGAINVQLRRLPLDQAAMRAALQAWDNPLRAMMLAQYRA